MRLIPTTRPLWEEAARLRAETGLKTPDALHAAAAMHAGCTHFITNDDDFRRLKDLLVVVLDNLLKEENRASPCVLAGIRSELRGRSFLFLAQSSES